jgi:hypothetical protein
MSRRIESRALSRLASSAPLWVAVALLGGWAAGCGDGGGTGSALEIAGRYQDDYGTLHSISDTAWNMDFGGTESRFVVLSHSNAHHYLLAQNHPSNAFGGGLFSRFDWTRRGGELWFCQTAYDAPDWTAVQAVPAADASDPASGGCAGFAWSRLTPDGG